MHVVGIKCTDKPVCAMAVAVFESSSWQKPNKDIVLDKVEFAGLD
jgi:hypothetical protein